MDYRRVWLPGGTYFFTIALQKRHGNELLTQHIDTLRQAVSSVRQRHPFHIHAWVVLPEHLHCIIELPAGDANYAKRWWLIKSTFSRSIPTSEHRSATQLARHERGIWQRRYWEHVIRNDEDYFAHMDYVHFNPVKHGYVENVADWPYSTYHRLASTSFYPPSWSWQGHRGKQLNYED